MHKLIQSILFLITTTQSSSLECQTYPSLKPKQIPQSQINDNYCDCPYTGEDEPNTSACSGSLNWSNSPNTPSFFQCKGQNLQLPSSHVNDGICDCCSGNDEPEGKCEDICEEVLAEERRLQKEMKRDFDIGYKLNLSSQGKYKEFVSDTQHEIEDLKLRMNDISVDVVERTKDYKEEIRLWRNGRRRILEENILGDYSWILALSPEEAHKLILGLCQLSGEWWYTLPKVTDVKEEEKTCIPLHLAAFELGYMFDNEFTTWKTLEEGHKLATLPLLLLEWELGYTSGEKATTSDAPDYDLDDEAYFDSGDDWHDDVYDEDEIIDHEKEEPKVEEVVEEKRVELVVPRSEFELEAKKILNMIQAIFDTPSEEEEEPPAEEDPLPEENKETDAKPETKQKIQIPENIDTIQLQKTQKEIKTYLKHITIGKNYIQSANTMIQSLYQNEYLQKDSYLFPCILLSLIYHSRLSPLDLYSILYHTLGEINGQGDVCDVPYIERRLKNADGSVFSVTIPSKSILEGSARYCQERRDIISSSCEQSITVESVIIPYNPEKGCISNHFPTSYHQIQSPSFQSINEQVSTSKQTDIDALNQQIHSIQKEIEGKEKELNSEKYGSLGELYAFKDEECFEKQANQYVYEICMLSNAYQKEGSSKTSLGKFQSFTKKNTMSVHFDKGQRCWQGQNRKSKVDIMCGATLGELISTEEPEVCSYEFILKSFVGCTDDYARENGLVVDRECTVDDKDCSSIA